MKPNKAMLGLNVQVTDVDHGYRRIAAELAGMSEVELGVFGTDAAKQHGDSGISVGNVAFMHETGSGGMKQRSFIRAFMDENEDYMREMAAKAIQRIITANESRKQVSEALGEAWVKDIQAFMDLGMVEPPNAAATVEWKGHSIPMIGLTRAVRNAIRSRIYLPTAKKMRAVVATAAKRAAGGLVRVNYDFQKR